MRYPLEETPRAIYGQYQSEKVRNELVAAYV